LFVGAKFDILFSWFFASVPNEFTCSTPAAVLLLGVPVLFSIFILTLFFVGYAVVHSLLAGLPVKNWARRTFGPSTDRWYRLFYNIFATITLLPLFLLLALLPDHTLYIVPAPWRWLMVGGQLLALLGMGLAAIQTNLFHFIGIPQLFADKPTQHSSFTVSGFYNWVRHPIYFFGLLLIWLFPVMTVNFFVTYILFTIYFYSGSIYEERRLVAEFGPAYQEYQRRVPRLIPIPGRRYQ
jgi:protein-S-isoprenylcysteine O-methyltransferase Ste14